MTCLSYEDSIGEKKRPPAAEISVNLDSSSVLKKVEIQYGKVSHDGFYPNLNKPFFPIKILLREAFTLMWSPHFRYCSQPSLLWECSYRQ